MYTFIKQTLIFEDLNVIHLEQHSRNSEKVFKDREHDNLLTIVCNNLGYMAHKNIISSYSLYLR